MSSRSCGVVGCDRESRSRIAQLCNTHYFRLRRTGTTGKADIWDRQRRRLCKADGCDRPHASLGYCDMHYQRLKSHGDPTRVDPPCAGDESALWKGDEIGYGGAHCRVRRERGPASSQPCRHCAVRAAHWAYDHADPSERYDEAMAAPYSADSSHYLSLCVPCHKRFDLAVRR